MRDSLEGSWPIREQHYLGQQEKDFVYIINFLINMDNLASIIDQ